MSLPRIFATTMQSTAARAFLASNSRPARAGCRSAPLAAASARRGDSAISASVKLRLERDATLAAESIEVTARGGVVRLSGVARSRTERTIAETLARSVSGVQSVANEIMVRS